MNLCTRAKNLLFKYGISQKFEKHMHGVCRLLREKNPEATNWGSDDIILPSRKELLELLEVQDIEPCKKVQVTVKPSPIFFIFEDTDQDTIYDRVLSYFDLDQGTEQSIQKLFLNGKLFPDFSSGEPCLILPEVLDGLYVGSTSARFYSCKTPQRWKLVTNEHHRELTDFEKLVQKGFNITKEPFQGAITDWVLEFLPVDDKLQKAGSSREDIAKAVGQTGVFLLDQLFKTLFDQIQSGKTEPRWVPVNEGTPTGEKDEKPGILPPQKFQIEIDAGLTTESDLSQIYLQPALSAQMTFLLSNSRKMILELRASDFFLATLDTHPINFEASFSFPMIELLFRIY